MKVGAMKKTKEDMTHQSELLLSKGFSVALWQSARSGLTRREASPGDPEKFQWLTPHAADPYIFLVVVCRSCMSITESVCFVVPFVRP